MLTLIFIEDCTREKYFNQNSTNKILVIINIICFVISLFLSFNFYFEENIEDKSDEVVISDSIKIQNKDKQDLIQSSNLVINNPNNNNNQNHNNNLINNEGIFRSFRLFIQSFLYPNERNFGEKQRNKRLQRAKFISALLYILYNNPRYVYSIE